MKKASIHRGVTTSVSLASLIALSFCASASADFKAMSQRLPASSNAIVAVNVAKLLNTPYGKEEWTPNTPEAWAKEPMMVPPGSTRILMAAEVGSSLESTWELTLMEMDAMPSMEALAAADGGHIDRLWDKDAVCSPINAYFIPLDANLLASITPANRTAIAKWVRTPVKPDGNVTSAYLQKVLPTLNDSTDIVMALDLEGAFGVPRIRKWLDDNDIKGIADNQLDEAARTLGTMNGITLVISVDKEVTGKAVIDFDKDVAPLKDSAKSIMLELLNSAGMRIDDVQQWKFTPSGKQIVMEGKLSTPALRKLLSIVQSPIPAGIVASEPAAGAAGAQGAQAGVPLDPAQASQRYYKAICTILDNFKPGTSPSESATWARAAAKRIEQMPILHVDPQLVQWGGMVSTKIKQVAAGAVMTQTQMNARVAGIADPAYSQTVNVYNAEGTYATQQNAGELENAKRQRRQAALEQKAQAQQQAIQMLNEIAETRPAIRQAMVEKYKVEF